MTPEERLKEMEDAAVIDTVNAVITRARLLTFAHDGKKKAEVLRNGIIPILDLIEDRRYTTAREHRKLLIQILQYVRMQMASLGMDEKEIEK